jgi:hypothetical protein
MEHPYAAAFVARDMRRLKGNVVADKAFNAASSSAN